MASKVIAIKGDPFVDEQSSAAEAITPGHLVDWDGSGNVIKHAGAGLNAAPAFALERDEMGNTISTAYASGDYVKVGTFSAGMQVNALIASGQNITKGGYVESAGDGTVRAIAEDAATDDDQREAIVGRAVAASGAVVATTRLVIEIV